MLSKKLKMLYYHGKPHLQHHQHLKIKSYFLSDITNQFINIKYLVYLQHIKKEIITSDFR